MLVRNEEEESLPDGGEGASMSNPAAAAEITILLVVSFGLGSSSMLEAFWGWFLLNVIEILAMISVNKENIVSLDILSVFAIT
jgi:hypothetical protein